MKTFLVTIVLLLKSQLALALIIGSPIPPATSITVHIAPSEKSAIIHKNVRVVAIDECLKDWCSVNIWVLKENKIRSGWVKANSIKIENDRSEEEKEKAPENKPECNFERAAPIVKANVDKFKCHESLYTGGYDKCTTSIDFKIETSCEMKSYTSLSVKCSVALSTSGKESLLPNKAEGDQSTSIYLSGLYTSGSMEVETKVDRVIETIISAKLKDFDCKVREY